MLGEEGRHRLGKPFAGGQEGDGEGITGVGLAQSLEANHFKSPFEELGFKTFDMSVKRRPSFLNMIP